MEGFRFIESIRLRNVLSFGPEGVELPLEPLNVLIGPNGSGKSNLIEALSLFAAAPRDIQAPIRQGGGVSEWIWKGTADPQAALVELAVVPPTEPEPPTGSIAIVHGISFRDVGSRFELVDERVVAERPFPGHRKPFVYYSYGHGQPLIAVHPMDPRRIKTEVRALRPSDVAPNASILAQKRDQESYPELTYLAKSYERVRFYRDWNFGRRASIRSPQRADMPGDFLLEGEENLGLVLNDLRNRPAVRKSIVNAMRRFNSRVIDFDTKIVGGTVQVVVHEANLHLPIPASRLSDGTLRYLCLLAILCHPNPPPVVCIEEPELGLHPDAIPLVAELLIEASSRTQIFATTHSPTLVGELSKVPESVVVCEQGSGGTRMRRLDEKKLAPFLEDNLLGDLWRMGEIGGNPR